MNKKEQKISVKIVTLIHGGIYGDNIYQNGVKWFGDLISLLLNPFYVAFFRRVGPKHSNWNCPDECMQTCMWVRMGDDTIGMSEPDWLWFPHKQNERQKAPHH